MNGHPAAIQLDAIARFFRNSLSVLSEKDSGFKPKDEMMTVAQQVRHTWMTIEWFNEGAFSGKGFAMDFEEQMKKTFAAESFDAEMKEFDRAMDESIKLWSSKDMEDLKNPIENDNLMGGAPKISIVTDMTDHTAHHRGNLVVYARLLGYEPRMPYGMD